jgi:hypothetical protein
LAAYPLVKDRDYCTAEVFAQKGENSKGGGETAFILLAIRTNKKPSGEGGEQTKKPGEKGLGF